jgi:P4 family phage/plasmid primase-like protien
MSNALQLFAAGYRDLVSVIPPAASLAANSKIAPTSRGKAPGRKRSDGQWVGFAWQHHRTTIEDVRQWEAGGANIGLRAQYFPGLDIDSLDEHIGDQVEQHALAILGPAPLRVGRAPKRLLVYRTDAPFTRMRLWIEDAHRNSHPIEVLGNGQQYVVEGIHPGTGQPYGWPRALPEARQLSTVSVELVDALFAKLTAVFEAQGYTVTREGNGRRLERTVPVDQTTLHAPSIQALQECVAHIPNANELYATREDYIKMGYAIRAAAAEQVDEGFELFADWCDRWDGGLNDPETVQADWDRMKPPFSVGWGWLVEQARPHGFNDAAYVFPVEDVPPPGQGPDSEKARTVEYSEQYLADLVVDDYQGHLRSVPAWNTWLLWDGQRWAQDATRAAEAMAASTLRRIAAQLPATEKGLMMAQRLSTASKVTNVLQLARADRRLVVTPSDLDADPWVLNTPAGTVDLRTGALQPLDPNRLATKVTGVPVDQQSGHPLWDAFLNEATNGDPELVAYLQRFAGYLLTGSTDEHVIAFVHGSGGNGKSVFLNTLHYILGDYATQAPMSTFIASKLERHPAEVAALRGARLVTASETNEGGRWNEALLKSLSGGDPITARFLYGQFFTFQPRCKLLLVGNHKPALQNVDVAMRRRFHLVPFTVRPKNPDLELTEKLRTEAPSILAWMIDGALAWQAQRLNAPEVVRAATEEYFQDEDVLGRWIAEECELAPDAQTPTQRLFEAWREWCNSRGEYPGSLKRLSQTLTDRGFQRQRDNKGRSAFVGIRPANAGFLASTDGAA